MSDTATRAQETQHAFLVAWGWFAEHIGLIKVLSSSMPSPPRGIGPPPSGAAICRLNQRVKLAYIAYSKSLRSSIPDNGLSFNP